MEKYEGFVYKIFAPESEKSVLGKKIEKKLPKSVIIQMINKIKYNIIKDGIHTGIQSIEYKNLILNLDIKVREYITLSLIRKDKNNTEIFSLEIDRLERKIYEINSIDGSWKYLDDIPAEIKQLLKYILDNFKELLFLKRNKNIKVKASEIYNLILSKEEKFRSYYEDTFVMNISKRTYHKVISIYTTDKKSEICNIIISDTEIKINGNYLDEKNTELELEMESYFKLMRDLGHEIKWDSNIL